MLPYWLLLLLSGVAGYLICERKKSHGRDLTFLIGMTVVMVAMAAVRANSVGVDTKIYTDYFENVCSGGAPFLLSPDNIYKKEIIYSLINLAISFITDNIYVAMGIISAIIIALRAFFIYRYSSSVWVSIFVFVGFGFFGYSICTLRQELAISVFLFALPYLQKRKLVPYLIITTLAAFCHFSLWIMLPVYFIVNLPLNGKTFSVYAGGTLLLLLFSEPIMEFVTQFIYKDYVPGSYYMLGRNFNTAFVPLLLFGATFLMKRMLLERDARNIVLINFMCYAALLFILTLKHFIFQRLALICLPVALLLIPELLACVAPNEQKYTLLTQFKSMDKAEQKKNMYQYNVLKQQQESDISLYWMVLGTIIIGTMLYYWFLLSSNRLLLVPYVTMWQ